MQNKVYSLILSSFLLATVFISPIYAQDTPALNNTQTQPGQAGGAVDENSNARGATTDDDGWNLMWLLPLLLIPLIILLWPKDRDRRDENYAGAKGGRAQGNRNSEDRDMDED